MVTVDTTRAAGNEFVEAVAGKPSRGQGVAAPMGYPESDSMESMAAPREPQSSPAPAPEPSFIDSAWQFLCSMSEGAYNFVGSLWHSLMQLFGFADTVAVENLTKGMQLLQQDFNPHYLAFPNTTLFALKLTANGAESKVCSFKSLISEEALYKSSIDPKMSTALNEATLFAKSHDVTKIEMFMVSLADVSGVATREADVSFAYNTYPFSNENGLMVFNHRTSLQEFHKEHPILAIADHTAADILAN